MECVFGLTENFPENLNNPRGRFVIELYNYDYMLRANGTKNPVTYFMRSLSGYKEQHGSMADYIANREGLKGASRALFLRQLHDVFGFKLRMPSWLALTLGAWVAGVAVAGGIFELSRGLALASLLPWLGIVGLGIILVIILNRTQRQAQDYNREFEWRAYCLLIRPMILAERPGLLDRNLQTDQMNAELWIPSPSMKSIFGGSQLISLWLPAAAGWGVGAILLVLCQFLLGPELWPFVFPILGTLLAPFAWGIFRSATYTRVKRTARAKT